MKFELSSSPYVFKMQPADCLLRSISDPLIPMHSLCMATALIRCYLMVRSDKEAINLARMAAKHIKQPAQQYYVRGYSLDLGLALLYLHTHCISDLR